MVRRRDRTPLPMRRIKDTKNIIDRWSQPTPRFRKMIAKANAETRHHSGAAGHGARASGADQPGHNGCQSDQRTVSIITARAVPRARVCWQKDARHYGYVIIRVRCSPQTKGEIDIFGAADDHSKGLANKTKVPWSRPALIPPVMCLDHVSRDQGFISRCSGYLGTPPQNHHALFEITAEDTSGR